MKPSLPRPGFQLIPHPSAQARRPGNKALIFVYSKKSDLSLAIPSVLLLCTSCNSLHMVDLRVENPLLSLAWLGTCFFYSPSLWLFVALLTTLESLLLLFSLIDCLPKIFC